MSMLKKLDRIMQTKQEIGAAIVKNGGEISADDTFASYADKIGTMGGGKSFIEAKYISDLAEYLKCPVCEVYFSIETYSGDIWEEI